MMHEIAFVRDSRRRRGKSTSYHHRLVELIVVVLKAPQLNSWNEEEEELPWSVAMFLLLLLLIVHTLPIYLPTYLALTLTDWLVFMRERENERSWWWCRPWGFSPLLGDRRPTKSSNNNRSFVGYEMIDPHPPRYGLLAVYSSLPSRFSGCDLWFLHL